MIYTFLLLRLPITDILHEQIISKIIPHIGTNLKVVLLGDILHNHEKIFTTSFNQALNFIRDICEHPNVSKVYLHIGNHDLINNTQFLTDNHPFNACKNWNKLIVVDHVIMEDLLIFTPYVPNGRLIEALDNSGFPWKQCSCVFSHVCINGARYGAITVTDSNIWRPEFPILISGHLHENKISGTM